MAIATRDIEDYISKTHKSINRAPMKSSVARKFVAQNEKIKLPNRIGTARQEMPSTEAPIGAPNQVNNAGPANTGIGNQQAGIVAPGAPTRPEELTSDPLSAIAGIGKAENRKVFAEQEAKRRQDALAGTGYSPTGEFSGGEFTGGGAIPGLDAEQSQVASQIIQIGRQRGMSDQQIQIGLMTAFTESGMRNVNYGDRDSLGIFQQRPSQGWGSVAQVSDPNYSINKFYDALKSGSGPNPWNIAQSVQRSFDPTGSNYQKYWGQAQQVYKAAMANNGAVTSPTMGKNGSATWINNNIGKYHDYDGAYGAQCVDLYNFYTSGFVGSKPRMAGVVGAKDIWNNYDPGAYVRVDRSQAPKMGDVVIWGSSWGSGYGHVGIVAGRNPNGTLRVLNANATSAGPRGNTVMSNLSTSGMLGYLRPRKLM